MSNDKITQAKALLAILSGSPLSRRPRLSYAVLKSSLYPIPHDEQALSASSDLKLLGYNAPNDTLTANSSAILVKRTTRIDLEHYEDFITSSSGVILRKKSSLKEKLFYEDNMEALSSVILVKRLVLVENENTGDSISCTTCVALTKG